MKLRDNLYTIVGKNIIEGKQSFIILLNPSCSIYAAHFPGMPITPGVCIIQIVEELLEELIGHPLHLCTIRNAKFLSVLKPDGQKVLVNYSVIKEEDEFISSQVTITDLKNNVYARLSLQTITA